jgi:SAM-dependent methyltransferase
MTLTRVRSALTRRVRSALVRLRYPDVPERVGSPERPATVEEMMPPPGDDSVGVGDFRAIGEAFVEELKRSCGLKPGHHVLDIGCGIGRIAIPLTQYLSRDAQYAGFDPVKRSIEHCRARIAPSYPNFRFELADLYNKQYNPEGRVHDHEYTFPYPDRTFDVAFAVSVFTHLLPGGAERYIAETARVLKPGGRFLATFFLLNDASTAAIDAGKSTLSLPYRQERHRVQVEKYPEAAVGYDEDYVLELYRTHGLELTQPTGHGVWSGREPSGYGGYQDLVVAAPRGREPV